MKKKTGWYSWKLSRRHKGSTQEDIEKDHSNFSSEKTVLWIEMFDLFCKWFEINCALKIDFKNIKYFRKKWAF